MVSEKLGCPGHLCQGVSRQPQRFVQIAAGVGQKEGHIVQGGSVFRMCFRHGLVQRPGFVQASGSRQSVGQIFSRRGIIGSQVVRLLIIGERAAMVAREIEHFGHAPPEDGRLRFDRKQLLVLRQRKIVMSGKSLGVRRVAPGEQKNPAICPAPHSRSRGPGRTVFRSNTRWPARQICAHRPSARCLLKMSMAWVKFFLG